MRVNSKFQTPNSKMIHARLSESLRPVLSLDPWSFLGTWNLKFGALPSSPSPESTHLLLHLLHERREIHFRIGVGVLVVGPEALFHHVLVDLLVLFLEAAHVVVIRRVLLHVPPRL